MGVFVKLYICDKMIKIQIMDEECAFMSKNEEGKHIIKKPALDRAGLRGFMGNPEDFELTFYGVFMACAPLITLGVIVWLNWK